MAYTPKPKLNDVIKSSPPGTKFTISVNNPQGIGKAVTCKGKGHNGEERTWISYAYDVIYNRAEYVYWVNSDNHRADLEKLTKYGTKTVTIEAVDYYNEQTGKTTTMYDVRPSGTDVSSNPALAPLSKPSGRSIAGREEDMEMYRHSFALEVFSGLIREKQPLELTDKIKTIIDIWSRYSAGLDPVTFPSEPARSQEESPDLVDEDVDGIPF